MADAGKIRGEFFNTISRKQPARECHIEPMETQSPVVPFTADDFFALTHSNPVNVELLARLPTLALPQCHLTAGRRRPRTWA